MLTPAAAPLRSVLIVDDQPMIQTVIRMMLETLGVEICEAGTGAQAVQVCRDRRFDVVLMDMQMPGMDGLQATRAIRRLEAMVGRPPCRIVMLTGHADEDSRIRAAIAGANQHLPKPIELDQLVKAVLARAELKPCH